MALTLNGSGGITYPDGSVNTTRSVSTAGDTMTGALTVPSLSVTSGNVGIGTSPNAIARLHVAGLSVVADDGAAQDTTPYGTFGVTRSSAVTGIASYIALTRSGNMVYAMGISDSNTFVIGPPDTNKKITNTRLSIDTTGFVTLPFQPAFHASGSFNGLVSPGSTLQFAAVGTNVGGHFSTASYTFTAPKAGIYLFSFSIYSFGGNQGSFCLVKNGGQFGVAGGDVVIGYKAGATGDATVGYSAPVSMAAGDTMKVAARTTVGDSYAYLPHSIFSGYFLG